MRLRNYFNFFRAASAKKEQPKQAPVPSYSPRSKIGTLLPEFPNIDDLKLPDDIESDKVWFTSYLQSIQGFLPAWTPGLLAYSIFCNLPHGGNITQKYINFILVLLLDLCICCHNKEINVLHFAENINSYFMLFSRED